jgi:D-alanyl-D-alanine carboxypeptidase (penicillin-binding protein 5/6)
MDEETGTILWEKEAHTPRYPASTTKIMTAMILLENTRPTDILVAPRNVEEIGGASIHLKPGEKITARDALYAMMVKSANDVAHTVAIHLCGSVENFAKLANQRARQIGCRNFQFANPHGLPHSKHVLTAYSLALIAREAMRLPQFREAVATQQCKIRRSEPGALTLLVNKNRYLKIDKTADGIKTGWTASAGHCYVGSATRDGHRVITVLLKSKNWIEDNECMLNWAFKNHEWHKLADAKKPLTRAKITEGEQEWIQAGFAKDLYSVYPKTNKEIRHSVELKVFENIKAPVHLGAQVGVAVFKNARGHEIKAPLIALESVPKSKAVTTYQQKPFSYIMLAALLIGSSAFVTRRRQE